MSTATAPEVAEARSDTAIAPVLVAGGWHVSQRVGTFQASNPKTRQPLSEVFPISGQADLDAALAAADACAALLRAMPDVGTRIAAFLERYAGNIEAIADKLVATAAAETGLPVSPRLKDVELPRTTGQLRQAATAAREGTWLRPTIDTKNNLRSCLAPVGPVWVIGPNNFPFAFNGISGGDFAAAIAAGNPVIAKAHPLHPATSRLLAEQALDALKASHLPVELVQMVYHVPAEVGVQLVRDPRLKAIAFTGSRAGGLKLKAAADAAGKPFFGELSSINPTVILPGALAENAAGIADQLTTSVLMGAGQFCTKPGVIILQRSELADAFVGNVAAKFVAAPAGTLFSAAGETFVLEALRTLRAAGAEVVVGGRAKEEGGCGITNTLLRATASQFLADPHGFQTEAFGNAALLVIADDLAETLAVLKTLEGSLTGTIYSSAKATDDAAYAAVDVVLRPKVGRLLNDKMPTGVAVSPAMNHGGPFPATSQPHFSAVGLPGSILRFTQLESYDNVREPRLPTCLQNKNPTGKLWRSIDGTPTLADVI